MDRLTLSKKVLIEKDFDVDIKGYKCQDVDMFFDYVVTDYENFEKIINDYKDKIVDLEDVIADYTKKIEDLVDSLEGSQAQLKELEEKGAMNFDNIERMGNIEAVLAQLVEDKKK